MEAPDSVEKDAHRPEGWLERACQLVCEALLAAMVLIVGAEALARGIAGIALETADEMGGYLLVAFTFLSLSVCQSARTFHHLELVQARLSRRGRDVSMAIFDFLALICAGILLWQLSRVTFNAWNSGEVAQTDRLTPLWIPMLSMPIGAAALCLALIKALIVDIRRLSEADR